MIDMRVVKTPYKSIFCCDKGDGMWFTNIEEYFAHEKAFHSKKEEVQQ